MKTAVEWYAEQSMRLEIEKAKGNISISQMLNSLTDCIEQAKEMEKKQMRDASCPYVGGWEDNEFEYWYNETFK
jgi:hypothetical protein